MSVELMVQLLKQLEIVEENIEDYNTERKRLLTELNSLGFFNEAHNMVSQWFKVTENLKEFKAEESDLRRSIFEKCFTSPKEGTNKIPLQGGWQLEANVPYTRTVDKAVFMAIQQQLIQNGIKPDVLVEMKPSLNLALYRKLSDEHKLMFNQCLTTKQGSPSFKIIEPKKKIAAAV